MLELLHICPDDKFIDIAIELFNSIQCHNSYVCVKEAEQSFNYIKSSHVVSVGSDDLVEKCKNSNYDIFVFHTLDFSCYKYVLSIPIDKKIIWISWGYDLYQPLGGYPAIYPMRLFKPVTQRWINAGGKKSLYKRIKEAARVLCFPVQIYKLKKESRELIRKRIEEQSEVLERIDYISTVLPSEYSLLKENRHINAKYFPFQYTSISKKENRELVDFDNAQWLLIGNSATATNNHLDIFDLCKKRGIQNTLYVPIAYGDKTYAEVLKKNANGLSVVFQENFLSAEIYRIFLRKCRVCVFGHLRQQALGNVVIALLQGSKVFLYKESMVYNFLYNKGCSVFAIEEDLYPSNIDSDLPIEVVMRNRQIVLDWFSVENVMDNINKILRDL